jgi:hypothetical protein
MGKKAIGHGNWTFYVGDMTKIANGDLVTQFTPGFAGKMKKWYWIQGGVPVTTGGKAATLNLEINAVNVNDGSGTNSTIALTSAACTPMGIVIAGSVIGGANCFSESDTISVEASSVTAFSEGDGQLVVEYEYNIL